MTITHTNRALVRRLQHAQPVSAQLVEVLTADPAGRYAGECPECLAPSFRPCRNPRGDITKRHEARG